MENSINTSTAEAMAKVIRNGLKNKNMSQRELARLAETSQSKISDFVNLKRVPTKEVFSRICRVLYGDENTEENIKIINNAVDDVIKNHAEEKSKEESSSLAVELSIVITKIADYCNDRISEIDEKHSGFLDSIRYHKMKEALVEIRSICKEGH